MTEARRAADTFTVVSFHAHPDDEALLTGGTLAKAASEGHRVVVVVATNGEAGLAAGRMTPVELRSRRRAELAAAAQAIGVARVVELGYPDSGWRNVVTDPSAPPAFSQLAPEEPAEALARILREEAADVLTTYDAAGGYGHPDHVQVHRVGQIAAALAGTPVVLEATVDRAALRRATSLLRWTAMALPVPDLPDLSAAYTASDQLTHRVDVRPYQRAKVGALRAHASQAGGGDTVRTLALLLGLPRRLRDRVLGTEWFREVGRPATRPLSGDIFASLRRATDDRPGRTA